MEISKTSLVGVQGFDIGIRQSKLNTVSNCMTKNVADIIVSKESIISLNCLDEATGRHPILFPILR